MTHVVIPTAREPRNWCLPYALESIRKHTDLTPVTVGFNTGLNRLHITTVQAADPFANTDLAVLTACDTAWVSDPFILSADDIYWLRPAAPIMWALGQLDRAEGSSEYAKRKRHTLHLLKARNLPTWDYESHTPMPVHKNLMLAALAIGGEKRTVYGNLNGQPDRVAPDVKMRKRDSPLPDAEWASTAFKPDDYPSLITAL